LGIRNKMLNWLKGPEVELASSMLAKFDEILSKSKENDKQFTLLIVFFLQEPANFPLIAPI
jgi:hypothetical protein